MGAGALSSLGISLKVCSSRLLARKDTSIAFCPLAPSNGQCLRPVVESSKSSAPWEASKPVGGERV